MAHCLTMLASAFATSLLNGTEKSLSNARLRYIERGPWHGSRRHPISTIARCVQQRVLYGPSGGQLVITFALYYPEQIRGVVAGSGYYHPHWRLDSLLAHLPIAAGVLYCATQLPSGGARCSQRGAAAPVRAQPGARDLRPTSSEPYLATSQIRGRGRRGPTCVGRAHQLA